MTQNTTLDTTTIDAFFLSITGKQMKEREPIEVTVLQAEMSCTIDNSTASFTNHFHLVTLHN